MAVRFDPTKEVPSLALCKRLKELGFPQDRDWLVWVKYEDLPQDKDLGGNILAKDRGYILTFGWEIPFDIEIIKAPTVRELGEWLPNEFCSGRIMDYLCENMELDPAVKDKYPIMHADTEANARAKMLTWLAENGYVKFKEVRWWLTLIIIAVQFVIVS